MTLARNPRLRLNGSDDRHTTLRRYVVRVRITCLPSSVAAHRPSLHRRPDSQSGPGAGAPAGILEQLRVRESLRARGGMTEQCPGIFETLSVLDGLHPPQC